MRDVYLHPNEITLHGLAAQLKDYKISTGKADVEIHVHPMEFNFIANLLVSKEVEPSTIKNLGFDATLKMNKEVRLGTIRFI